MAMSYSARSLPPPKSLIAFEAAARNVSFTGAAKELNVTRVAVSRQIRHLEDFIGMQLFERGQSGLRLTDPGRSLYRVVRNGFQAIADELEHIMSSSGNRIITIATTVGISTYWLMPVIGRYREVDPDVNFRLLCSSELLNLVSTKVDVAIRYGDGRWPGVVSTLLARQSVVPLCSRALLERVGPIRSLRDLNRAPLLEFERAMDHTSFWKNYFRDHGLSIDDSLRMDSYELFVNFIQAILDGQGIGLSGNPLMKQFIESGVLVPALEIRPTYQRNYYMCWPEGFSRSQPVRDFSEWLFQELSHPAAVGA